jgi:hypothetical protein
MNDAVETVEPPVGDVSSVDADLAAAWDKAQENKTEPEAEPVAENKEASDGEQEKTAEEQPRGPDGKFQAKDEEEKEPETPEEFAKKEGIEGKKIEPPGNLPFEVKQNWDKIPKEARDAFVSSQNEMTSKLSVASEKLAEATRVNEGLKPVQDALVEMVRTKPEMANVPMAQIVDGVRGLYGYLSAIESQDIETGAGTFLSMLDNYGLTEAVKAKLGGQEGGAAPALPHAVAQLQRQIEAQNHQISELNLQLQQNALAPVESEINRFAESKGDQWQIVQDDLPPLIEDERGKNPAASPMQVLEAAYDRAIWGNPKTREMLMKSMEADRANGKAEEDAAAKSEDAKKAAAINVKSAGSGKASPKTIEQELSSTWDRLHASG